MQKNLLQSIKLALINSITQSLRHELSSTLEAANNARLAAIDEQSKAETQYDTLAIEAAYLAEGQTKRIDEINYAIEQFNELTAKLANSPVSIDSDFAQKTNIGSLVRVFHYQDEQERWYFLAPAAAGFTKSIELPTNEEQLVTVITPQSPLGNALVGKVQDDEFELIHGDRELSGEVAQLY